MRKQFFYYSVIFICLVGLAGTFYLQPINPDMDPSFQTKPPSKSEVDFPFEQQLVQFKSPAIPTAETISLIQTHNEIKIPVDCSIEVLQDCFENQPVDPAWSSSTSTAIYEVLSAQEFRETQVIDVDCRATICRVAVWHTDPMTRDNFEDLFPVKVLRIFDEFKMDYVDQSSAQTTSLIYLVSGSISME